MLHFLPNALAPHFLKQPDCLLLFVSQVSFDTEIPLCVAAKALLLHGERKDACCLSPLLIVHYVGKVTAGPVVRVACPHLSAEAVKRASRPLR